MKYALFALLLIVISLGIFLITSHYMQRQTLIEQYQIDYPLKDLSMTLDMAVAPNTEKCASGYQLDGLLPASAMQSYKLFTTFSGDDADSTAIVLATLSQEELSILKNQFDTFNALDFKHARDYHLKYITRPSYVKGYASGTYTNDDNFGPNEPHRNLGLYSIPIEEAAKKIQQENTPEANTKNIDALKKELQNVNTAMTTHINTAFKETEKLHSEALTCLQLNLIEIKEK